MTDLLLETELDTEQKEFAGTVQHSGEALLRIINDILDFSKIESGKIELSPISFDLPLKLNEFAQLYNNICGKKNLSLNLQVATNISAYLHGDWFRINQVLINLVGNAIKFTPAGGTITLSVSQEEKQEDTAYISFAVSDTGIGIAEEKQKDIFSAFVQADAGTTRRFGGTGLGLAISASLVELMGGQIDLESTVDRGSTFYFTLPLAIVNKPEDVTTQRTTDLTPLATLNVLVAEDNHINQKVISKILQNDGHHVAIADNGRQALELFANNSFDIILMDIQMPQMDGVAAMQAIRETAHGASIPIIALTANALKGDRERYKVAGFDEHVSKPVKKEILFNCIHQLTKKKPIASTATPQSVEHGQ